MAKFNPIKVKQAADKQEKAGRFDQAISLYRQIVEDNKRDWNTINKIGDLYGKLGKTREASQEYAKVAEFYARDGFLLKAIAIWKKINKLDTSVLEPYLNLADLYAKQGLMMEAKGQYQVVVEEYVKRGRSRDAADVLKKIVEIDPGDLKFRSKLADLYTRDGNKAKAVGEYVAIAEELNKKGHLAEALQVLEKGLKLDSSSNRLREELARIHLLQKNYERAAQVLEEALETSPNEPRLLGGLGEAYLGAQKVEEAEGVFRRLLEHDPSDQEARIQMARVHVLQGQLDQAFDEFVPVLDKLLERREGERAASILQQLIEKDASHVRSLVKLVEIYRVLQNDRAVIGTYGQLTEAYIKQGQLEPAASVLDILISMEPDNDQYKSKLQFVREKQASEAGAPAPSEAAAADDMELEEGFDLSLTDEVAPELPEPETGPAPPAPPVPLAAIAPGEAGAAVRPSIELSPPPSEEDTEFIEEHLAEGRVFRKYGLIDKAADQFDAVVARFADNAEARLELKELYEEKGQNAKAAEHCLALAEIARLKGEEEEAAQREQEAEQLSPGSVPAAAAPSGTAESAPPEEPPIEEAIPDEGLEVEPIEEEPPVEEAVVEESEPVEEEISLEEEVPLVVEEGGLEPLDLEAAAAPPAPVPEPAPAEPLGLDAPGELSFDLPAADESGLEELAELPSLPPPEVAPLVPKPAAPSPEAPAAPAELQRLLEEVDSYVSLGFVDDAREALREVRSRYPDHPLVLTKSSELGLDQEPAEPPAPAAGPPSADDLLGQLDLTEASPAEIEPAEPAGPEDLLAAESPEPAGPEDLLGAEPPQPASPEDLLSPDPPEAASPEDLLGAQAPPPVEPEDLLDSGSPAPAAPEDLIPEAPPAPTPEAPTPDQEGGFDLGAELGDLFGAQSAVEEPAPEETGTDLGDAGLSEVFKEFRQGVDRQLDQEDYDTRYNLGIAYKEMGLVDEAIAEFQLAAKDPNRILECTSMLGICFMEKGMPKLAIKWFEKGLEAPGRTAEELLGLRYDLAVAYEAGGDVEKALGLFSELSGQDANFRDVASKIRDLKAAR